MNFRGTNKQYFGNIKERKVAWQILPGKINAHTVMSTPVFFMTVNHSTLVRNYQTTLTINIYHSLIFILFNGAVSEEKIR
jgi:hypothetical protein